MLEFSLWAATNSLCTSDNLSRWGKLIDPRCALCHKAGYTLGHILSSCYAARDQERYTLRHDSVLLHLFMTLNKKKTLTMDMYADLEGYKVNTIPMDILVTDKARPDLVLVDRSSSPNSVTIVDLTIP